MADISVIKLPSGSEYNIKDAAARESIAALESIKTYLGITTTALTDGATTTSLTIGGETVTVAAKDAGAYVIYGETEFVWNGSKWQELGSTSNLGELAFEDTAEGKFTPQGSVSLTNSNTTVTVGTETIDASHVKTYTPSGSVSLTTSNTSAVITTEEIDSSHAKNYTPAGTVSLSNENTTTTVGTEAISQDKPKTYTPAGTISLTDTAKTPSISASAGTAGDNTFQCDGSVAAPTISVATAGDTGTFATGVSAVAPGQTAPSNSLTYYSVSGETLSLYQIGYGTASAKTGDAAYEASAPGFTGSYVKLANGSIDVPTSASFSGSDARLVTGNISVPTSASFSGNDVRFITDSIAIPSSASFSGDDVRLVSANISIPSSASFTGTEGDISVSKPSTT